MMSYGHPNTSAIPPVLAGQALDVYQAIEAGEPVTITPGRYTAAALYDVARKLDADRAAAWLTALGIEARSPSSPQYCAAAVFLTTPDYPIVDAEAAVRIGQRVQSGLSIDEAIRRTLAQCEQPCLSETALRELEDRAYRELLELERRTGDAEIVDLTARNHPLAG